MRLPNFKFNDKTIFFNIVCLFSTSGAFISGIFDVYKLHYLPIAISIIFVATPIFNRSNKLIIGILFLLALLSPVYSVGFFGYAAFISSFILPIIWFQFGKRLDLKIATRFLIYYGLVLVIGLFIEINQTFYNVFPEIGFDDAGTKSLRYGSFTLNSLSLGYVAAILVPLSCVIQRIDLKIIGISCGLTLLYYANSRGAAITLSITILSYMIIAYSLISRFKINFLRISIYALLFSLFFFLILDSSRFMSIFDWSNDSGNLGRLNQWSYCLNRVIDNPLSGTGAGTMGAIGMDSDPYISEGVVKSCDNTFLKLAYEYNIFIMLLYLGIIMYSLTRLFLKLRKDIFLNTNVMVDQKKSDAMLYSNLLGIFFQQFINQTVESVFTGAVFFTLLGYLYNQKLNS